MLPLMSKLKLTITRKYNKEIAEKANKESFAGKLVAFGSVGNN